MLLLDWVLDSFASYDLSRFLSGMRSACVIPEFAPGGDEWDIGRALKLLS